MTDILGLGYKGYWEKIQKKELIFSTYIDYDLSFKYFTYISFMLSGSKDVDSTCTITISFHNHIVYKDEQWKKHTSIATGVSYKGKIHSSPAQTTIPANWLQVYEECSKHSGYPFVYNSLEERNYVTSFLKNKQYIKHPTIIFSGTLHHARKQVCIHIQTFY